MMRRLGWLAVAGVVWPMVGTGCTSSHLGSRVHVDDVEDRALSAVTIRMIDARTHNGHIAVTAGDTDEIAIRITKKTFGSTMSSAQEAMGALEVVTEQDGDVQKVYWRWTETKHADWGAGVSYDVTVPERLAAKLRTHNGPVELSGIGGDAEVETHNGKVDVNTASASVTARTHNGGMSITAPVREIMAKTHNGGMQLNLTGDNNVTGSVRTHNGGITLAVQEGASAQFECTTRNGGISVLLPTEVISSSRRRVTAKLGDASGELRVQTHNGGIRVKKG